MQPRVNFVFCVHNHQPVGNFDQVFAKCFTDAYQPFLDAVEPLEWFRYGAHFSGPLLEWIQEHRPDFLARLRRLVEQDRLELIGGGMYEPIFSMLPEEDVSGQIEMMSDYLDKTFGSRPTGAWVPERVWEQPLARLLVDAGIHYTMLDDFHFRATGLRDEDLTGYFLTEDQGRLMNLFPIKEELRYAIPFKEPQETIDCLLRHVTPNGSRTIVYADDGEKFGVWPKTQEHVYANGWLKRFLKALEQNLDRIRLATFRDVLRAHDPVGRIYLPTCSYREMGEWTMLGGGADDYKALVQEMQRAGRFDQLKAFLVGGYWRNFKAKYPEANLMYGRMLAVSRRVARLSRQSPVFKKASRELYRAQCNCAYWHGVFGGIYLPHLRDAIYRHLIAAERLLEGRNSVYGSEVLDVDLDGSNEVHLHNKHLGLVVSPTQGGQIVSLDLFEPAVNLQATLSRKPEPYHAKLLQAASNNSGVKTIHDIVAVKGRDLEQFRKYDRGPRYTLGDHFYPTDVTAAAIDEGNQEQGDLPSARYDFRLRKEKNGIVLLLRRRGWLHAQSVRVEKEIWLKKDEAAFEVNYVVANESAADLRAVFGVEFNFALVGPFYPQSFVHTGNGTPAAPLTSRGEYVGTTVGVTDRTRNIQARVNSSHQARFFVLPVQTISSSESGLELILQSVSVTPTWSLDLKPGEEFRVTLTERFD